MLNPKDYVLRHGTKLNALALPGSLMLQVGKNGVREIMVVLQNGEMAAVPWALVTWHSGNPPEMYNLAHVEWVRFDEDHSEHQASS